MNSLLIDTSVLIDHLRQYAPATEFLENVFKSNVLVCISSVTEMELYAGKSMEQQENEKAVSKILDLFEIIPVASNISRKAGVLLRKYRQQGLTPIDAIIAGTSLECDATLVTRNVKHFRMIEGILVFDLPYNKL